MASKLKSYGFLVDDSPYSVVHRSVKLARKLIEKEVAKAIKSGEEIDGEIERLVGDTSSTEDADVPNKIGVYSAMGY